MFMLKESFKIKIIKYLDETCIFKSADCDFLEEERKEYSSNYTDFQIKLKYDDSYFFIISVPDFKSNPFGSNDKEAKFWFEIKYSPGEYSKSEVATVDDVEKILKNILQWTQLIKEEFLNTATNKTFMDEIKKQEEKIAMVSEKIMAMEDGFISKEESEVFVSKLEEIEENFIKKMNDQASENKKLKSELDKMKEEIKFLKETVNGSDRKKWLKMLAAKIISWSKNPANKQLVDAGVEIAKNALPEEIKNVLHK